MTTVNKELDRAFANIGGLAGLKAILRFAQRRKTTPPRPRVEGKPLAMPSLTEKGKGKRK